jgi:glutamate-1-semialdehyde 2,1-aminomutase/spore coat polysaccharide biosynthesis protein SpsF
MVRFGKNGSDATAAAVRAARAYTGREKVACCGYHGWQDWYIGSTSRHLGVPECVRRLTLRFPYNDLDALHRLFEDHSGEIACVIMEPVVFDAPRPGYLESVRELCHSRGALLVFDEIVTGFRFAPGGAQEYFGVTPDLACFGKAMANGFPLSAVVGRAEIMRTFTEVFFSSTFGGETLSLAACLATIRELKRRDGIARIWRAGRMLREGANALVRDHGLEEHLCCAGFPPWNAFQVKAESPAETLALRALVQQESIRRGILSAGSHFFTVAHDDTLIAETLAAYSGMLEEVAAAVREGNVERRLAGPPPQPIIRQA